MRHLLLLLLCASASAQTISATPATTIAVTNAPNAAPNNLACGPGLAGPTTATEVVQVNGNGSNLVWKCIYNGTYAWVPPAQSSQAVDGSGNPLVEKCIHTIVTSNTSGAFSATWASLGSNVSYWTATSVATTATLAGATKADVFTVTPTGITGFVEAYGSVSVLTLTLTIPFLSTAATQVSVGVCATP